MNKQKYIISLIMLLSISMSCFLPEARAEESNNTEPAPPAQAKAAKKEKVNVLDFEGELIEGERKKPDLILQIAPQDLNFDSLLYIRHDFNDFLEVDKNTRPRFIIKSKK